jgi:UDP-2,3-diacylglucosamine pyrophosphatase LpxH
MHQYKSVFISDVHLGTKMSQADKLLDFLKTFECENLFLVGDIVDGWAMSSGFYWPQSHNDVIQKILRKSRKGTNVYYVPGNHDEFLRSFCEIDANFGNIVLAKQHIYTSVNGKKFLIMHGDEFDVVINNMKWLSHLGSWAYDFSIYFNIIITKIRNKFKLSHWSLSAWLKYKVKKAVNFISDYEENLSDYALSKGVEGIICGHIHHPNIRDIKTTTYVNCGDWVETCSAVVEHQNGTMEIIYWR